MSQWLTLAKRVKAKLTDYVIFDHSLTYIIPLVGRGQELMSNTYKSWDLVNKHQTLYQITIIMFRKANRLR